MKFELYTLISLNLFLICYSRPAKEYINPNAISNFAIKAYEKLFGKPLSTAKDAMGYLVKYGYMEQRDMDAHADMKTPKMKAIVIDFQRFMGITETGELDNKTMEMMNTPRCGVPDNMVPRRKDHRLLKRSDELIRVRRYQLQGSVWEQRRLTWRVSKYSTNEKLRGREREVDNILQHALNQWAKHTQLDFVREAGSNKPLIDIKFTVQDHHDGNPFDGPGKTLAHAFFPRFGGSTHFDDQESWSIDGNKGVDLLSVAVHEFGHALGLGHSDERNSIMFPTYAGKRADLKQDDINGIEMLYGKRNAVSDARPIAPNEDKKRNMEALAPDLCRDFRLDAADCVDDGICFFFRDNYIWRIKDDTSVHEGYPKKISDVFPGVSGKIDAAFTDSTLRQTYLLKGDRVWIYKELMKDPIVANQPISEAIKDLGVSSIDAASRWSFNGKTYIFKNEQYWRFDSDRKSNPVSRRYPQSLRVWYRVPNNVDAAMYWPKTQKTYFFKGPYYYRFNDLTSSIDEANPSFPREASKWWLKCNVDQLKAKDKDIATNEIETRNIERLKFKGSQLKKSCANKTMDESRDPSNFRMFVNEIRVKSTDAIVNDTKLKRLLKSMKGLLHING